MADTTICEPDAPYNRTGLPKDFDADTYDHLLTSSCKPTKITSVRLDI